MSQKVVFEVTQQVVDGNQVVIHSGEQYGSLDEVPDGVTVRPVLVTVPGKPAPEPAKHAAKAK